MALWVLLWRDGCWVVCGVGTVVGAELVVLRCALALGAVGGAFMIASCAYAVASSSAMVSMTRDGSPLWILVPPVASVTCRLSVGLTALIYHPVLLMDPPLHAPSDCMNMLAL